ncbi:MAG: hypothetical protein LBB30_01100 [Candidatus Methanoplasma sp.]|jgi:hypothetical protein|nr:hypothetical protein [Candidatus Methanoplasma sp.]
MFGDSSARISSPYTLVRHPVFLIAVIGIAVRLCIFPFVEVGYDSDFWATIIGNIEAGEGLYGLEGYYYTPVWGYILSFMSVLQETFLNIDVMGLRVPAFFLVESYPEWFFSSTVTSVEFNFWVKVPLLISDLIIGYLVYWLIKDKTQDMRKATIGFGLWFLCPLVIFTSSISGMFDTFSVLFALLCIIMVRKDRLFLAGILFSFAVLTKFFPIYLAFLLIAYIIAKHRGGAEYRSVAKAVAGVLAGFLMLMAPQIADGTLSESVLFITTRVSGEGTAGTLLDTILSNGAAITYIIAIFVSLFLAWSLSKKSGEELDDSFFKYALLMVAVIFIFPPAPQYLVLLIPFLAIYIVTKDPKFKWSWALVSVGGAVFILGGNFVLFMSLGTFTDLMPQDHIMSMIELFQTPAFLGASPMSWIYYSAGAVQYAGILLILLLFLKAKFTGGRGENGGKAARLRRPFLSFYKQEKV